MQKSTLCSLLPLVLAGCSEKSLSEVESSPSPENGDSGEVQGNGGNDDGVGDDADPPAPREPKGPAGSVWMTSGGNAKIVHLDAEYEELASVFEVGEQPTAIAHGAGYLWYARNGQAELERVDATGAIQITSALGARDVYFDSEEAALWCTTSEFVVSKIDPETGSELAHIELEAPVDDPVLAVGGAAWVMADNSLLRVGATEGDVETVDLSDITADSEYGLAASAYGEGQIWFAIFSETAPGYLVQVDEATREVSATLEFPTLAHDDGVGFGFDSVWLSSEGAAKVFRITPGALTIEREFEIPGGHPQDLEIGAGSVWFVDMPDSKVWRLLPNDDTVRSIELAYPPSDLTVTLD